MEYKFNKKTLSGMVKKLIAAGNFKRVGVSVEGAMFSPVEDISSVEDVPPVVLEAYFDDDEGLSSLCIESDGKLLFITTKSKSFEKLAASVYQAEYNRQYHNHEQNLSI